MSDDPARGTSGEIRRAISSVSVGELHGKFTFSVEIFPQPISGDRDLPSSVSTMTSDRLTLLYGRNGTGKTSLLRLIFHALSPSDSRGHRNALRRMRFAEFAVHLTDGSYVKYWRPGETQVGGFHAEIRVGPDSAPISCEFWPEESAPTLTLNPQQLSFISETLGEADALTAISVADILRQTNLKVTSSDESRFVEALGRLALNPIFLEDSRAITGDMMEKDDPKRRALARARSRARERDDAEEDGFTRREVDVDEALDRVRVYLSQLAFAGTQAGSLRVDTVYVEVASAIIEHSSKVGRPNKRLVPELRSKVESLNERAARFQQYGLLPESPMLDLATTLEKAEDRHGPLLSQVLTPHLDGFEQRMDALEPGLDAVAAFVDALNAFLSGKHVRFNPGREGLTIIDSTRRDRIQPQHLSSGEKQIVLMFSDIVALQDETRLFLIDEPELSLNPDWQRKLMPALLSVTEASGMQLVAATHSIEIMSRYRDRRRRLPE